MSAARAASSRVRELRDLLQQNAQIAFPCSDEWRAKNTVYLAENL